jgi:MoaA/NifB/PqqE/SkfB family radical SAM enzyme
MTKDDFLDKYNQLYDVIAIVDLDFWTNDYESSKKRLLAICKNLYKEKYDSKEKIIFLHQHDVYVKNNSTGLILRNLQVILNETDITSCFVTIASTNPKIDHEILEIRDINVDDTDISIEKIQGSWTSREIEKHPYSQDEVYQYGSVNPIKIKLRDISERKKFLLTDSKRFCIYPWIHLHAYPTGEAWPCCHAEMAAGPIGHARQNTLRELWNSDRMRELRLDMLNERHNDYCVRCYEQEEAGFFGGRQSANKHHGHLIDRIDQTKEDGRYDEFQMTYWDIRFSNLCNLRCRSCGHIFSSQWYQDQARLAGPEWKKDNQVLNYAGRYKTDMWEQLLEHIDYVEQIYFAGGEPLLMEEHYNILEELERRGRFDVRLIYNTNFTEINLKDRVVFDYWKRFKSVAVGASLDAMGPRAEYIRKGTDWEKVESNRRLMLEICPEVDFYISPTLSIMNAWHLPDFHRDWVERGFIKARDLNVNVLQDPAHYRVDIATREYKEMLLKKYQDHLEWLRPQDDLNRATQGFESVINFMMATDNTPLIDQFWRKTHQLDDIRKESVLDIITELSAIK